MSVAASRRASFKQADATRALNAAKKAGMSPCGFKIDPGGAITVMFHDGGSAPSVSGNPWDEELMG